MIKYDESQIPWNKESRPEEVFDYDNIEEGLEKGLDVNVYHIVYNSLHKGVEFVRTRVLPVSHFKQILCLAAVEDKLEIIKRNLKHISVPSSHEEYKYPYIKNKADLCDIYVVSDDDSKIRKWIETLKEYSYFKNRAWHEIKYQRKLN